MAQGGKGKTTRKTVPAGAKRPADRLAKTPRVRSVTVPMDDQAVRDLEQAKARLEQVRQQLAADRDVRAARLLTERRQAGPGVEGDQYRTDLATVRAEVDTAIAAELEPLEKAERAAWERVEATSRTFTFHSIGNRAYQELLKAHPATDDDHEQVKAEGRGTKALYHAETFAPVLVEACCDELDADDVAEIFDGDTWNLAEIAHLFMAAYEVNTQRSVVAR